MTKYYGLILSFINWAHVCPVHRVLLENKLYHGIYEQCMYPKDICHKTTDNITFKSSYVEVLYFVVVKYSM